MPSSTKTVIALSGFLGRASDWSLIGDLGPPGWHLHAVNLWTETVLADFDEWAQRFVELVDRDIEGKKVILGYSMGGRLALHALLKAPSLFDGAMIVSANPGFISEEDRLLRRKADEVWASKFLKDPWPDLMREWNEQTVLRAPRTMAEGSIQLERLESDFDRRALAQMLRTWSLGSQRNLRAEVNDLPLPMAFVTGREDLKFTALTREWLKEPARGEREHLVVDRAGHRVPWDAPNSFRAILAKFLSRW